jgi:DNA repair photolyase
MKCEPLKGRGALINPPNRFEALEIALDPSDPEEERPALKTRFYRDLTSTLITTNDSPDIGITASINAYRGCEHGCSYCFARPYHEYLGFSSGTDFESKIMVKTRAPEILRSELSSPRWKPQVLAMSGVTDCYQPAERLFKLTRGCLEVLAEFRNPVGLITKNHLITRDLDLLKELARHQCVRAYVSITTLNPDLARKLEPRAAAPDHRLDAVRRLSDAGVPVGVMMAPIIPGLTDSEIPALLQAAAMAGASSAGYTLLRLPYAVKDIFIKWLETHFPEKKDKILSLIRSTRKGKLNDSAWGDRLSGHGPYAGQIEDFFRVASHRNGLDRPQPSLSTAAFRRPPAPQMELF